MPPRPSRRAQAALFAVTFLLSVEPSRAAAQSGAHAGMRMPHDSAAPHALHLMAQAIPLLTRADPAAGRRALTEGTLAQAFVMARGRAFGGHLLADATLNLEGLTMRRGELSTGAFGEGFIDRRHPHTYMHELVVTAVGDRGPMRLSASAGRGFVPFGTDDPMVRPLEKYPVNHHLSQILERTVLSGAARLGAAIVEVATFNGDEPTAPTALPRAARVGDSWSLRGTLLPAAWAELQASYARVASPEETGGHGLDHRKQSVSARFASVAGGRSLLAEWARTVEHDHDRLQDVLRIETALVEGTADVGPVKVALRLEQTDRPEEERLADPFRTTFPGSDLSIGGITRWRVATAALSGPAVTVRELRGYPFVEVARLAAAARDPRTFATPERFYGASRMWMVTTGLRLQLGAAHARMSRYGAALVP